jgi:serine/threonine protein phosphatase 1
MRITLPNAKVPDGIRIYAIGDLHGRADLIKGLFAHIDADLAAHSVYRPIHVLLGDYIDRGPASREVLDQLVERSCVHKMVCLKGNHEVYLTEFLENPSVLSDWGRNGGLETLRSYGLSPTINPDPAEQEELAAAFRDALPSSHRHFLSGLKSTFVCGDFFFAHAGIRPGIPLARQREEDLLWIRDDFLLYEQGFTKIVVHGHTPVLKPDVRPNRINIDTGAYATGRLTCLVLTGNEMQFI